MDLKRVLIDTPHLLARLANVEHDPCADMPVLSVKIKPLWQCNLACVFCTLPDAGEPMSLEMIRGLLHTLHAQGLQKVHYSGGEIFLHPQVFDILEASCALGLQVNLTTNGTLLDREAVKRLSKMRVHSVSVSLDAAGPEMHDKLRCRKGAFKSTHKALRLLTASGKKYPRIRVNTVVTSKNIAQLSAIHDLLDDLPKAVHWKIIPVDSLSSDLRLTAEMIADLADRAQQWYLLDNEPFTTQQLREERFDQDRTALVKGKYGKRYYDDHRCYMPWLHLFIEPNGFVYPCCMSRGRIAAFGNIYQEPLDAILRGSIRRECQMSMAAYHAMPICRYCDDFIQENSLIDAVIEEQGAR